MFLNRAWGVGGRGILSGSCPRGKEAVLPRRWSPSVRTARPGGRDAGASGSSWPGAEGERKTSKRDVPDVTVTVPCGPARRAHPPPLPAARGAAGLCSLPQARSGLSSRGKWGAQVGGRGEKTKKESDLSWCRIPALPPNPLCDLE